MYKFLSLLSLSVLTMFLTQCKTTNKVDTQDPMTLSAPEFSKAPAYYNTYVSGQESGGSGIEFYLEVTQLAEGVKLENLFFRESVGKLMMSSDRYVARFRTDNNSSQDIIMSDSPLEEAVNTPPVVNEVFPFPLLKNQAGITYTENGVLKYAIISNIEERESIAYPGQKPKGDGN